MGAQGKYAAIADVLGREIDAGKYGPGTRFPSIAQVMRRFSVSRLTAVRALDKLGRDGRVVSYQGRGTFVAGRSAPRRIGLILHGTSYCEIFAPVARRLSHLCQAAHVSLLFADISFADTRRRVAQVMRLAHEYAAAGIDGVIFQPVEQIRRADEVNAEILAPFDAARIPVVLLDSDIVRSPARSPYDIAAVNHFDAGRRLAAHLREVGARRVAYLVQEDRAPCVEQRLLGLQTGCAGLPLAGEPLFSDPDDAPRVRRFLRKARPDAMACYNDMQASVLEKTLAKLGVAVPDDMLVAGFDDVNFARLATPALTTMRQPCDGLAELAFDMLAARMANPSLPPRTTFLDTSLVVRESTRPERTGKWKSQEEKQS